MMAKLEARPGLRQMPGFISRDNDADVFVAFCPAFDLRSQGESKETAKLALIDAVEQHLAWHLERGSLSTFLTRPPAAEPLHGERVELVFAMPDLAASTFLVPG